MWLILFFLAGLAMLGHLSLCAAAFNRVHATEWPYRVIRAFSTPTQLATFVVPLALGVWAVFFAPRPLWDSHGSWLLTPLGYLPVCWAAAVIAVAVWIRRRLFARYPQALVSNHTSVLEMPRHLSGDPVTAALARIPGNQILQLHVQRKVVQLPRLSRALDGLRLTHVSDLHMTGQLKQEFYRRVVDRANDLDGDLVAVTGDLVDNPACLEWIPETLGKLRSRFGVFFVLGNHDLRVRDLQRLRRTLTDCGLVDLSGRWLTCSVRGQPVVLAGNEMPWIKPAADLSDCPATCEGQRPFRIGLAHTPDQIGWAQTFDVDLMLAGHTHGGQICPPGIGPVVTPARHPLGKIAGAFQEGPTLLHISRGIAGTRPIRINCPPELTLLVLTAPPQ